MRGKILGIDASTGSGAISGSDGKRYSFARDEWRGDGAPQAGVYVDFDSSDGSTATSLYPEVKTVFAPGGAASPPPPPPPPSPPAAPAFNDATGSAGQPQAADRPAQAPAPHDHQPSAPPAGQSPVHQPPSAPPHQPPAQGQPYQPHQPAQPHQAPPPGQAYQPQQPAQPHTPPYQPAPHQPTPRQAPPAGQQGYTPAGGYPPQPAAPAQPRFPGQVHGQPSQGGAAYPGQAYPQAGQPYPGQAYPGQQHKSKVVAGLLALFLGTWGVHKFYLGYTTEGFIMLGATIASFILMIVLIGFFGLMAVGIVAFVEAIIYLTKTDEEFDRIYVQHKKAWF